MKAVGCLSAIIGHILFCKSCSLHEPNAILLLVVVLDDDETSSSLDILSLCSSSSFGNVCFLELTNHKKIQHQ